MSPQKWKLLSRKDVSPNPWLPIESRSYQLPNGEVIDDFTVAMVPNASMTIPITLDKKVVLIRQFKPGADDIILQFPSGGAESPQADMEETAIHELEQETGIKVDKSQLHFLTKAIVASTKNTETVFLYLAENCSFNSQQRLDPNEDIEVVELTFSEVDEKINSGEIWCVQTIAGWELAKKRFPEKFQI